MRTKLCTIICMLLSVTAGVRAQQHIEQAFKELRKTGYVTRNNNTIDRDPVTNTTKGMREVSYFDVPKSKRQIIAKIEDAFENDKNEAYTMSAGVTSKTQRTALFLLVEGDSNNQGEYIASAPNTTYVYSCFLDGLDETKTHRYAYALEYKLDGKHLRGKIVKVYGTTLESRQKKLNTKPYNSQNVTIVQKDQLKNLPDIIKQSVGNGMSDEAYSAITEAMTELSQTLSNVNGGSSVPMTSAEWLGTFGIYCDKLINDVNDGSAYFYVSEIYGLCKNAKMLSDTEKNIVATSLSDLLKGVEDKYQKMILNAAIEALKE